MLSQEDFFATQESQHQEVGISQNEEVSRYQPQEVTQHREVGVLQQSSHGATSVFNYLVLFDWNSENKPFGVFPRTMFTKREVMDQWVDGTLDHSSRMKCLSNFQCEPGKKYSLFGKIETGTKRKLILFFFCLLKYSIFLNFRHFLPLPRKNCKCTQ